MVQKRGSNGGKWEILGKEKWIKKTRKPLWFAGFSDDGSLDLKHRWL
nr:MAG TPA: hypothetical protein [Caudoviricetes sp.]